MVKILALFISVFTVGSYGADCDSTGKTDSTNICFMKQKNGIVYQVTQTNGAGKTHGFQKHFYRTGKLSSLEYFIDGCQSDTVWHFFENGTISAFYPYNDCRRHGKSVSFHENGDTARTAYFEDGKQEGKFLMYHQNGNLKEHRLYKNGKRHGADVVFSENGTRIDSIIYDRGEIIEEHRFFNNGKLRIVARIHSKDNKDITYYDPKGKITGKIIDGDGKAVLWADDDNGGYRSYEVKYKDGRKVYE